MLTSRACLGDFGGSRIPAAMPLLTGNRGEYFKIVGIIVMIEWKGRYLKLTTHVTIILDARTVGTPVIQQSQ